MDLQPFLAWAAPIASTALTTYVVALINRNEKKREEETRNREQWREDVNQRLTEQDAKIDAVLKGQTTQMRSDLLHKAHRYVDDLGCASTEEKDAFWAEYEDYMSICDANNITNHFIEQLAQRVMDLPNRDI